MLHSCCPQCPSAHTWYRYLGCRCAAADWDFLYGWWDLNSGLHVCPASPGIHWPISSAPINYYYSTAKPSYLITKTQKINCSSQFKSRWTLFSEELLIPEQVLKCSIDTLPNILIWDSGTCQAFSHYSSQSSLLTLQQGIHSKYLLESRIKWDFAVEFCCYQLIHLTLV